MARKPPKREEELKGKIDEDDLLDLYTAVEKGFEAQRDRSNNNKDNWDLYNCRLSDKQFYNGTSKLALPFVRDAVEARVTRFKNQLFPVSGRYVEVTTGEEDPPMATQALLESYVRKTKLATEVVPALLRNGDIEGMYVLYVTWGERSRDVVYREKKQPMTGGIENLAAEPVDDFKEETLIDAYPDVEVCSDSDFLLLPAASDSLEDALEANGSATLIRRWSKGKIKQLKADGEIDDAMADELMEEMSNQRAGTNYDTAKAQLDSAGVKERGKIALVYEVWTKLKMRGWDEPRLCRVYFSGEKEILSVRRNPFWNDRCPIIAAPLRKMAGTFKSQAPVVAVSDLQILANDTINEAADTAHFSAMPIVMTDPIKNPRVDTMTLALAAVWETAPDDTQIVQFPELWKDGLDRAMSIQQQIFQTLGVNPAMIPQSTGGPNKKRSQAEIAMEQQVDLMTTADVVTQIEEAVLTPLIQRFAEYDHQYRDEDITIRVYGEMGLHANMEKVEPIQLNNRFEFRWFGAEAARNAAQMQQGIAWLNVIKQIPPQQYPGYDLDLAPMMVQGTENAFGPRLAPLIFKKKSMISVDPMIENDMLLNGFHVQVNPADDDQMHLQVHMLALEAGDPHQTIQEHMMMHQQQMQAKVQAQAAAMMPQGQPGQGGPPGPGGKGPRQGAMPGPPKPMQQPPGAIHKDSLPKAGGVVQLPRKM